MNRKLILCIVWSLIYTSTLSTCKELSGSGFSFNQDFILGRTLKGKFQFGLISTIGVNLIYFNMFQREGILLLNSKLINRFRGNSRTKNHCSKHDKFFTNWFAIQVSQITIEFISKWRILDFIIY